jgi:exopolysaccharide biosynthesis predicted pyruvyltransferase EpsI
LDLPGIKPSANFHLRTDKALVMFVEKVVLGDWLKSEAAGQVIYWCPNPGNAGDALIAVATEDLFRQKGIDFRVITDPGGFNSQDKFVCYGGGGNLVPPYVRGRQFLEKHHESAARLVILPHTVAANEDLLARFSSRVTIICRELISYSHCRAAAVDADVLAADDVALSLNIQRTVSCQLIFSALTELRIFRFYRRLFRDLEKRSAAHTVLEAWRDDGERHPSRTQPSKSDLAKIFSPQGKLHKLGRYRLSAHFFLRAIDRFTLVRTDRLHLAIGAALLGKKVELHSNRYFKNRAVYDFSLRLLPNVRFVDLNGREP